MKICVLAKQVPDKNSPIELSDTKISLNSPVLITNESDSYAIEEAIQIKERLGAEVVICSLGPETSKQTIKDALSKGADRGIHIPHENANSLDPLVQGKIIAESIRDENFDIVLSGLQSDDSGNGQIGIIVAEYLSMSHASLCMELDTSETGTVKVKRELESGWFQWIDLQYPAAVTIQSGINKPRYASLKGIMMMKKKPIDTVEPSSPYKNRLETISSYVPVKSKQTTFIDGSPDEVADKIISIIKNDMALI